MFIRKSISKNILKFVFGGCCGDVFEVVFEVVFFQIWLKFGNAKFKPNVKKSQFFQPQKNNLKILKNLKKPI